MVISLIREIFVLSNDAFMFMDAVVEWNFDSACASVVDFHRFLSVFLRLRDGNVDV